MDQPYIGSIAMVGFNFAPPDWAVCDGSLLSIADYGDLFYLLGTTFGGDGTSTFGLPDLRGRVPMQAGQSLGTSLYPYGQSAGSENVTLTVDQIPSHNHEAMCVNGSTGISTSPEGAYWARTTSEALYSSSPPGQQMQPLSLAPSGFGQAHENRQPLLAINFIIALKGILPPKS
jgi:microcystin-dependent protein